MTRDMELIRAILKEVQARRDLEHRPVEIQGADPVALGRHVELLYATGFLDGYDATGAGDPAPTIMVRDLSWEGHDFAAALGNETIWAQMKRKLPPADLATMPLVLIKDIGVALLRRWAFGQLGLDGG